MADLERLAHAPVPSYTEAQASSYDRASVAPNRPGWFANGDSGHFLRQDGREWVMADLKGPGAAVRFWSANPSGVVRFYFDGEAKPRIEVPLADLLTGRYAGLTSPFGYEAAQGTDLYFPFPYAKSLRVTVDDGGSGSARGLYYHIGYRTYRPGTEARTFQPSDTSTPELAEVRRKLLARPAEPTGLRSVTVPAGRTATLASANRPGEVAELAVRVPVSSPKLAWSDSRATHNLLRALWLTMDVDGERTVSAPLGDFFATAPGVNPYHSFPMDVWPDGTMVCRFPMPYRRAMRLRVANRGPAGVTLGVGVRTAPWQGADYRFHCRYSYDHGRTRPMRDMHFLDVAGQGAYVGAHLHIENPTGAWWGEGDEKVYVDGEAFPSTFGTGTEDYFGYAWGSSRLFQAPYHGQSRADGPGSFGHTNVYRWHLFDSIPYTRSLRFDMEMWHWEDVNAAYDRTVYWYAKPGRSPVEAIPPLSALRPAELLPPSAPKDAVEGESLPIALKTGGETSVQTGFWPLSKNAQLWWTQPKEGDRLVLRVPVPRDGDYEVSGHFCFAPDYGIHRMTLGSLAVTQDFYAAGLDFRKLTLGRVRLKAGTADFEVVCQGRRPEAKPGQMFGLDYLRLRPVR